MNRQKSRLLRVQSDAVIISDIRNAWSAEPAIERWEGPCMRDAGAKQWGISVQFACNRQRTLPPSVTSLSRQSVIKGQVKVSSGIA